MGTKPVRPLFFVKSVESVFNAMIASLGNPPLQPTAERPAVAADGSSLTLGTTPLNLEVIWRMGIT
jgi:hypothetical protein